MKNWQKLAAGGTSLSIVSLVLGMFLAKNIFPPFTTKEVSAMGSFGNAGTRTKRVFKTLVPVNLSANEHLHYFITAKGANPIFSLACEHKTLWSEQSFGPSTMNYDRVWPFKTTEADAKLDEYAFIISFAAATKYTFRVERHNVGHQTLDVMEDIDYESSDHSDQFREFFTVKTQ